MPGGLGGGGGGKAEDLFERTPLLLLNTCRVDVANCKVICLAPLGRRSGCVRYWSRLSLEEDEVIWGGLRSAARSLPVALGLWPSLDAVDASSDFLRRPAKARFSLCPADGGAPGDPLLWVGPGDGDCWPLLKA